MNNALHSWELVLIDSNKNSSQVIQMKVKVLHWPLTFFTWWTLLHLTTVSLASFPLTCPLSLTVYTWVTAHLTATGNCFVRFSFALRTELSIDHEVTSYWLRLREGRTLWSNSCYCSWGLVGVWRTEAVFMETSFLQRKFIIGMIQLPS